MPETTRTGLGEFPRSRRERLAPQTVGLPHRVRDLPPRERAGGHERVLRGLNHPAYVTGRRWDLLAWNDEAVELFADFDRVRVEDRNILVYLLLDPAARALFGPDWADQAQHDVVVGGAGRKTLNHPARGRLTYDYATFQANEDPALKLTIYTYVTVDPPST